MPIIESTYIISGLQRYMHYSTIYNNTVRKLEVEYDERKRLELSDGDFLDLDWKFSTKPTKKIIITLHGFEGNTSSKYMLGMAKYGSKKGYDVLGVNYRGCSEENNRLFRAYHAGDIADLQSVIDYALSLKKYTEIYINGFSFGGNLALLYLGSELKKPKELVACMAVSSPGFLVDACAKQKDINNTFYAKNFLVSLRKKLKDKQQKFPDLLCLSDFKKIKNLTDLDNIYTSKAHGFKDANDYYKKCSSYYILEKIEIPTLLLNAKNDSFLSPKCYPYEKAKTSNTFYFEAPQYGGHLGFYNGKEMTYSEKRTFEFFANKGGA